MIDIQKIKKELNDLCSLIGCSGMSEKCPGDVKCEIIRKMVGVKKKVAKFYKREASEFST